MNVGKEYLFDDYFDTINLNNELKDFYQMLGDEDLNESFEQETELIDIRNENYKRYNDINLLKIEDLSENFDGIVKEIKKLYSFILPNELLNNTIEKANENKKIINLIYTYLNQLSDSIKNDLKKLEKENDQRQLKIKNMDYSTIDKKTLEKLSSKYDDIVLYNSVIEKDLFDDYKRQLKRKKYINELYELVSLEIDNSNKSNQNIHTLNTRINEAINNLIIKVSYLEDLMIEQSKYEKEFLEFKKYFNNLIAYDDEDYGDINNVYNTICKDVKIKSLLAYFENSFIEEREKNRREETFIYEKYGIKNIRTSINYISANYMDSLSSEDKQIIEELYRKIDDNYNIEEIYNKLRNIVNNIWETSITDIYSYRYSYDYCFICTNNQFMDERHESILITNRMLERVTDYYDYQIGFIANFNNNIMYITENEDIMSIDYEDMSNLKTPKQIEQEFLNFKVCDRIALNGYVTKVSAVYFINDGDFVKYKKAVELANQHNLPLIVLKKDKN